MKYLLTTLPLIMLAGCAASEIELPQGSAALGDPAKPVPAAMETLVTTDPEVDADDPALWADPRDPTRAVLFGTDKTDGLYVHDMDGTVRQFLPDGPLNNVDLRTGFVVDGKEYVLVAATEREQFGIVTYLFDPDTFETRPYGFIATGAEFGEPYGFCTARIDGNFYLIPNNKEGDILVYRLENGAASAAATLERSLKVGSQPEGCVVDDKAARLYVGEENVAIWRFDLTASASNDPVMVAPVDGNRLTADVEGLTIMRDRGTDYLVASSQGDATYPVWRIEGDSYHYAGRFAVEGGAIDAVTGTDGLDAWSGPIGQFPEGAIAMHDTDDGDGQQNYKVVDWRKVREALSLR
ncbi:phytase [Parasphingorhabdus sp.]|uniref:phytase n=1 Tax=Parasphingorhabdus sp. TaxID=2709688 RepID=UPI002F951B9B